MHKRRRIWISVGLCVACVIVAGLLIWLWQRSGGSVIVAAGGAAITITVIVALLVVYLAGNSGEQMFPARDKPTPEQLQRRLYMLLGYGQGRLLIGAGLLLAVLAILVGVSEDEPLPGIITGMAVAIMFCLGGWWCINLGRRNHD